MRLVGGAGKFAGRGDDWSIDMLESLVNEEKVEDEEIHPDFLWFLAWLGFFKNQMQGLYLAFISTKV